MIVIPYILSFALLITAYCVSGYYGAQSFYNKTKVRRLIIRLLPLFLAIFLDHEIFKYFYLNTSFLNFIIVALPAFVLGDMLLKKYKK